MGRIFMSKITDEERIKAVEIYIQGELAFGEIRSKYGVPKTTLRHWIDRYRTFGADGLLQRKHNHSYSTEIKKQAVEEYLSGKGSYKDICKKYKVHSDTQLRDWIKVYNSHRELLPSKG
jgi:transposase-like protein